MSNVQALMSLNDEEPFPYRYFSLIYRPSVITRQISLFFGFRHEQRSWSIDQIQLVDRTTNVDQIRDGNFESNYLLQSYSRCILSNTRSSDGDIVFDLPYSGDFYYNDQTSVGMTYLIQSVNVVGGRYYNLSFVLENRGYPNNAFVLLVAS
jgi:hypothetical protein